MGWSLPRAVISLSLYGGFTLLCIPLQGVALLVSSSFARRFPVFYHRVCRRILGINVRVRGVMVRKGPVLFVANHTSYLDIMVLGSLIPGSFVAKAEVADWPFFGLLAKLQRTIFVRRRRHDAAEDRDGIAARLQRRESLIVFPEGTSSDGNRVLPFKSALFAVAADGDETLAVQPVSVSYALLNGMPIGRLWRAFFAWYGDMNLASHIWTMAGLGKTTVIVEFHPVATIAEMGSRKALAAHCHKVVAAGVGEALVGGLDNTWRSPRAAARARRKRQ